MAIRLVFNGYYKSGSTRIWWIMKRSNPHLLHIYEPLSPDWLTLKDEIFSCLHGLPIWEDYHTPEFKQIELEYVWYWNRLVSEYKLKLNNPELIDILPRDIYEVSPLFDLLHNLNKDVILQPNRCHFILDQLADRYDCKFVHIIRNPIDTWIALTIEPVLQHPTIKQKLKKYVKKLLYSLKDKKRVGSFILTKWLAKRCTIGNSYYLDADYKLISDYFECDIAVDYLDKLLVVWSFTNYYAWKQANKNSRGMIVYYEEIVRAPRFWFKEMERFSGVRFDLNYTKELTPKFITISEELREVFINRLDQLELLGIVEEFYPPNKWFGD